MREYNAENLVINDEIKQVDSKNVYSMLKFFGIHNPQTDQQRKNANGITEEVLFDIADPLDRLSYEDISHILKALVQQAEDMGLKDTEAYKALNAESARIAGIVSYDKNADPKTRPDAEKTDNIIKAMIAEMDNVFKKQKTQPTSPSKEPPELVKKRESLAEQEQKLKDVRNNPDYSKEDIKEIEAVIARLKQEIAEME